MHGIYLKWKEGELVEARCSTNQDFFQQIILTDPGASLLGEFAFGMNLGIDIFCKDILYDEKIGGTIHLALGNAYKENGGGNDSAIHWDIVKDMSKAKIILDDKIVQNKGRWKI